MTTKQLEQEGKNQIEQALKNVGMDYDEMIGNKCSECDHAYTKNDNQFCELDDKVVNAYGCDKELLGNNAEEIPNPPEDDPFDDFHSSTFCHEWQIGERQL